MAQMTVRLQVFYEFFKGQVLMGIGRERHLAHASEQLSESRLARQVGSQNQRVGEQPDQRFDFGAGTVRDDGRDHAIFLAGVTIE